MGAAAFDAEYAAGRALTSQEVLVMALGEFQLGLIPDADPLPGGQVSRIGGARCWILTRTLR